MPDFDLVPIDHDPFAGDARVPPYTNPSVDELLARGRAPTNLPGASLTNQPSALETAGAAAGQFMKGGLSEVLKNAGVQLPEASNRISDFMQSEPVNTAIGMTTPLKGAGVIQEAMSAAKPSITAYHASPHNFDEFDLSKIGTGEGNAEYGKGIYAAENPATSGRGGYYDKLFTKQTGSPAHIYEVGVNADPAHFVDFDKPLGQQPEKVQKVLRPIVDNLMKDNHAAGYLTSPEEGEKGVHASGWTTVSPEQQSIGHILDAANQATSWRSNLKFEHGAVEKALKEAGIPGIKYLDQGSRSAGEGSRNYVVFDDKLIDILKKYGIAGIGALPAMGAYHFKDNDLKQ
jgi:hypothetical protein